MNFKWPGSRTGPVSMAWLKEYFAQDIDRPRGYVLLALNMSSVLR